MAHLQLKHLQSRFEQPKDCIIKSRNINVVLFGKSGNGKSATGNTILGTKTFKVCFGGNSGTSVVSVGRIRKDNFTFNVFDYPGVTERAEMLTEITKIIQDAPGGIHVFIVVCRCDDRVTEEEVKYIELFSELFGGKIHNYTLLVATRGSSTSEFVPDSAAMERLYQVVRNEGLTVENGSTKESLETKQNKLLCAILEIVERNGGNGFVNSPSFCPLASKYLIAVVIVLFVAWGVSHPQCLQTVAKFASDVSGMFAAKIRDATLPLSSGLNKVVGALRELYGRSV